MSRVDELTLKLADDLLTDEERGELERLIRESPEAARALGVSETDVMTALTDGSLKGKKIGASWRVMRSALEEFLKG